MFIKIVPFDRHAGKNGGLGDFARKILEVTPSRASENAFFAN